VVDSFGNEGVKNPGAFLGFATDALPEIGCEERAEGSSERISTNWRSLSVNSPSSSTRTGKSWRCRCCQMSQREVLMRTIDNYHRKKFRGKVSFARGSHD